MTRVSRVTLWASAALALAYLVSTLPGMRAQPGPSDVWDTWVYNVQSLLGALVCAQRAVAVRRERAAWWALAAAMLATFLGNVHYTAFLSGRDDVPYPSLADGFWIAFYPLAYAGIVLLVRERVPRFHAGMWLDGLVSGLACAAVSAALAFDTIAGDTSGPTATVVTNLAYPAGDLLLLILVVGVFGLTGWRPGRSWLLLGGGLLLNGIVDTIYLYQVAAGTYVEGTWVDAIWPVATALMCAAAWQPARRHAWRPDDWTALAVPATGTLMAGGVLVVTAAGNGSDVGVVLAAAAVLGAVARTLVTLHETRMLAENRRLALTDDLTGLPNRRALLRELDAAVAGRRPFSLLLIDLDGFKELNDTLGHHVGDQLLAQLHPHLDAALRRDDVLARLGGDEFAVLLPGCADVRGAQFAGARVRAELARAFVLDGVPVRVDASIGAAVYPEHGADADALLLHADAAMYHAKQGRTGVETEAPAHARASDGLALTSRLIVAIERGELELDFQPKAALATGELTGVEALLRWHDPERGRVLPGEFLPAVEQTHVMRPLTEWVIATVLGHATAWRRAGHELPVAVNVAAPNLLDAGFPDAIARLLAEAGAAPDLLRLEVTEQGVLADTERAAAVLGRLRALGVGISIDDFGTGHSSLERLIALPVDELKVDKGFVLGMVADDRQAAVVEAAVTLGRRLGLTVVAEGVETAAAWDRLAELGCDEAQGYLLARPLPAAELLPFARRHAARGQSRAAASN